MHLLFIKKWAIFLSAAAWLNVAAAQATITGVADRGVYADAVTFVVAPQPGFELQALLDGALAPLETAVVVTNADYHELVLTATNVLSGEVSEQTIRFNVVVSERRGSEIGLRPWIPLPSIPSTFQETEGSRLRILVPAGYPAGMEIPVVAWVETETGSPVRVNGTVSNSMGSSFAVRRGSGSGFLDPLPEAGSMNCSFSLNQLEVAKTVLVEGDPSWTSVSGILSGDQEWLENSRISVEGDLTVPTGSRLAVRAGSVVRLLPGVRVRVGGEVLISGSDIKPVIFAPLVKTQPWGGFYLTNAAAKLHATATIFTGSGANPNAVPDSHRREECLFFLDNHAQLRLTNCAAISLAGQFGHSVDRGLPWNQVSVVDTLVQRCTTGGEWNGAAITILRSALIEMPYERRTFHDGDEDGIYFTTGEYQVYDSVIGWAGDDGIDAGSGGGSYVVVSNTWIESVFHDAFAWSGGNRRATNLQCVAINSGQGIECGWSSGSASPYVFADNCLVTANEIGARFGDNYDWSYNGYLWVTNSLLIHNYRDVWGVNWDDWTYRTNQMDIRDNLLTSANPWHPGNAIWRPEEDASRLLPFMTIPPGAEVGIGLALFSSQHDAQRLREGIPVRLSHFTTNPVSVQYTLAAPHSVLSHGTLVFQPGETVQHVPPQLISPDAAWVRLSVHEPEGAQITGMANAWFARPSANPAVLVPAGASWKYSDTGENLESAWREVAFDDSTWASGPAELGYGDEKDGRPEATLINFGTSTSNRHITYYFRHSFHLPELPPLQELTVKLKRDDGGIVYLNGQEAFRSNLPDGPIGYLTTASLASDDGTIFHSTNVSAQTLVSGTNVIAVEIHQESSTSSDVSFDLQLEGVRALALDLFQFSGDWFMAWDENTGTLLNSINPAGPWHPVVATPPLKLQASEAVGFYRLQGR